MWLWAYRQRALRAAGGARGAEAGLGLRAGSEREESLAGLHWEPSRDCRAGRAGDAAPPGRAVAGLRPERTRRAMEVVDETEALQRFFEGERPRGWLGYLPPALG